MNYLPLLILLLPAAGAVLLAGRGWRWPRTLTVLVGPGVVWLSFIAVLYGYWTNVNVDQAYWTWIRSGNFDLPFNLLLDHLSLFMCLVITGVGALIITYAVGYMEHESDASYARFFCYMDVFVFSMLLLVLAGNFVFLIVGWAMVGLSSYLLIGFYYWRRSAVLAARKAFVMNVIGDVGMILGTFIVFFQFHATTYSAVFKAIPKDDSSLLELAAFLFLVGAIAKSAQLPLHTWLPDAMEGPTPVSALIHAATMVTAGVYLVGRLHPIYDVAPYAHHTVAVIGAVSALFAASIAIVQVDIKRVLAYSTMSQIGYMFLAVGVGAYAAGFFHLLSHAFFKALLFMSAGNVIHAMDDEQDMRRFGGLWRQLRRTSISFLIGSLALVGVIPLIGFFSKEWILGAVFSKTADPVTIWLWLIGFATAILTGFYTGRMWWISFWGRPSEARPVVEPHEAPNVMLVPVLVLAALTLAGGILQTRTVLYVGTTLVEDYLAPAVGRIPWPGSDLEWLATLATVVLASLAFLFAYLMYVPRAERRAAFLDRFAEVAMSHPEPWSTRVPWLQTLLEHKYYFDEIYDAVFVRPLDRIARWGDRSAERAVIDGSLTAVAGVIEEGGGGFSMAENGYLRSYVLVFVAGALVAGLIVLWRAYA
ncbi:MAG TPA: NADH-quinone oxidoreductase subunit L [Candidatus Dormibacteraeota bacterium]|jgi:NADH-quinone oxidoreductase subunit L